MAAFLLAWRNGAQRCKDCKKRQEVVAHPGSELVEDLAGLA